MFDHVTLDFKLQELECETLPTGRTYTTPEGKKYPSVTTVLGASEDSKDGLNAWRQRIGEEEADKITRQAGARGTAVHNRRAAASSRCIRRGSRRLPRHRSP